MPKGTRRLDSQVTSEEVLTQLVSGPSSLSRFFLEQRRFFVRPVAVSFSIAVMTALGVPLSFLRSAVPRGTLFRLDLIVLFIDGHERIGMLRSDEFLHDLNDFGFPPRIANLPHFRHAHEKSIFA